MSFLSVDSVDLNTGRFLDDFGDPPRPQPSNGMGGFQLGGERRRKVVENQPKQRRLRRISDPATSRSSLRHADDFGVEGEGAGSSAKTLQGCSRKSFMRRHQIGEAPTSRQRKIWHCIATSPLSRGCLCIAMHTSVTHVSAPSGGFTIARCLA